MAKPAAGPAVAEAHADGAERARRRVANPNTRKMMAIRSVMHRACCTDLKPIRRDRQGRARDEITLVRAARNCQGWIDRNNMSKRSLHSVRIFVAMAVLAMVLAVISPFSAVTQVVGSMAEDPVAASMSHTMDCEMCPKADMALAGCAQVSCQMMASEVGYIHAFVTEPVRYILATARHPAEWHTVPPVSPG